MANLYEINRQIEEAWNAAIDPETGEISEDLYGRFEALQMERDEKIENIGLWIKNLRSDADQIKAEKMALAEREQKTRNKADRLAAYLESALDGEKIQTPRLSISYRRSSVVECQDLKLVPFEFLRIKEPEVDKTAVKNALKAGTAVPGCELAEHVSMIIK